MENNKIQTYYLTDVKNPLSIKSYFELYENLFNTIDFTINKELLEPPLNNYCSSLRGAIKSIIEYLKINNVDKEYYFILGKKINILLHNFENKMLESGIDISNKLEVKEVYNVYKELAKHNGLIKTKNYLPHAYEIEKEFNESIKIETTETKELNNLNYPDFFKNHEAFLIFINFIENDIADPLTDFSFIFQYLKHDNYIHDIKQKIFYNWLLENEYIKKIDFDKIILNNGLKSKSKCYSEKRINKYLRLKDRYSNTDSE